MRRALVAILTIIPLLLSLGIVVLPTRDAVAATAAGRQMGYGILSQDYDAEAKMGFKTTKIFAHWNLLEPSRGNFSAKAFGDLSTTVERARSAGLSVLLTVKYSPTWATGSVDDTAPPIDDNDFATFMGYLAGYFKGRVTAYEIWNEPNLRNEWGYQAPDPVKYAAMLRALYPKVKAADPNAQVITGGISTTGDGIGYWGYGDLLWIKNLYTDGNVKSCSDGQGGLRSCFDALGSHPYGGPFAPETGPEVAQYTVGMYFRRAEQQKQMMDVWGGDYDRGIWATEFNWLIDPVAFGVSCSWGSTWDSYKLTGSASTQEATQADYLVRAFDYAYKNWPWMKQMIAFNLDFPGSGQCDQISWYSLKRLDGSLRPAYTALANMAKPGLGLPTLSLSSSAVKFLVDPGDADTASRTVHVTSDSLNALSWTAAVSSAPWLTVSPTSGSTPGDLTLSVNKHGLADGRYSTTVTVAASGASNGSQSIEVDLYVGPVSRKQLTPAIKNG